MSLLVMGISHHSAPMDVLEKVATIDAEETLPVLGSGEAVGEVLLLSTCNRIEVYTEVSRFHAAVESLTAVLAKHAGLSADHLSKYLYVHYEDSAVRHAFRVASGLDSMVVGDEQILGQILATESPREHKALGRKVRGFDEARWKAACRDVVFRGNLAKFSQDEELRALLLATGDKTLVEASPTDRIWGIGLAADDPRALDLAREAYKAAPENHGIADTYGWILLKSGNIADSLPVLEGAARGEPGSAEVQYHYAAALAKAGQKEAAATVLRKLMDQNERFPSRSAAQALLDSLER